MPLAIEKQLIAQLKKLRDDYGVYGIKAEFEAEGSCFRDVMRLRRVTAVLGVELHVKIGGVEAVRDVIDCLELGADGIIAPMVESAFGAKKFVQMVHSIGVPEGFHCSINIETLGGLSQLDDILEGIKGTVSNVTVGRSDLSGSYMDGITKPNSEAITKVLEDMVPKVNAAGMSLTVGGTVNTETVAIFNSNEILRTNVKRVETRKVIMPTDKFISKKGILDEVFAFEKLYILSKKEFVDMKIKSELKRLSSLDSRTS
jgi:hypothetical protein